MSEVYLDASFFISLMIPKDRHHQHAIQLRNFIEEKAIRQVTSIPILLEIGSYFSTPPGKDHACNIIKAVYEDPLIEIIELTDALFWQGYKMLKNRTDKGWSIVDCISFHIMEKRNIQAALTADRHFTQAGFKALLTEDPQWINE